MIVHRNNIILLPDLENHVFPYSELIIRPSPIGVESLTFGQTSKLRFEISLIDKFVHQNYAIPLSALKNYVFSPFRPY